MSQNDKIIIVAEDEEPLLAVIKEKLEKSGFKVVSARTAEQTRRYVLEIDHIGAIWLDHYLLGQENGLDFVTWCKDKDNNKCQTIPIFVVSNTTSDDKVSSYLQLGIKEYMVKSNFSLDEIIQHINNCFFQEGGCLE
ncbi:MAG TPA: response regulator [Candidatus Paceibacterota bacterium]|nr:response regulator [Candidatus Paceibacterota bacterium]